MSRLSYRLAGIVIATCISIVPFAAVNADDHQTTTVAAQRLINADAEPHNWMSHGRTHSEQRFSQLEHVHTGNVEALGLAWYSDLDDHNVVEATPIVIDGRMYVTEAMGVVIAIDAATGQRVWKYDPDIPPETLVKACCQPVNRGVAAWGDNIYVGTLDGRLVAIDAISVSKVWEQVTTDPEKAYTITGAPRVVKDLVIIDNAGAEYDVRVMSPPTMPRRAT